MLPQPRVLSQTQIVGRPVLLENSMKEFGLSRKIIFVLFATIAFCLFMPRAAFCQSEKLDIVEYTPPQGWIKTPKEGVVAYSSSIKAGRPFALSLCLQAPRARAVRQKIFSEAWNELVVKSGPAMLE